MPLPVHIVVNRPDGQQFTVDWMESDSPRTRDDISWLKEVLHAHWGVPPLCQKLVLENEVLEDFGLFRICWMNGDFYVSSSAGSISVAMNYRREIPITLVISTGGAYLWLQSCLASQRQAALTALAESGFKAGRLLTDAVIGICLQDVRVDVAVHAWRALVVIADQAGEEVVTAVISGLHDPRLEVVCATVEAASKLFSRTSEESVVDALLELSNGDEMCEYRHAAVIALAEVSQVGDGRVVAALMHLFQDRNQKVRLAAIVAMPSIANSESNGPLNALSLLLTDLLSNPTHFHDIAATKREISTIVATLSKLYGECEAQSLLFNAVSVIMAMPDHYSDEERCRSLDFLTVYNFRGIQSFVISCLADDAYAVRDMAMQILTEIAARGDLDAMESIADLLLDPSADVKCLALQALELCAQERGSSLQSIIACLENSDPGLRHTAVRVLTTLAGPANRDASTALCRCLGDDDVAVRESAALALATVAKPGDEVVISALFQCLQDYDRGVRTASMDSMLRLRCREGSS